MKKRNSGSESRPIYMRPVIKGYPNWEERYGLMGHQGFLPSETLRTVVQNNLLVRDSQDPHSRNTRENFRYVILLRVFTYRVLFDGF